MIPPEPVPARAVFAGGHAVHVGRVLHGEPFLLDPDAGEEPRVVAFQYVE